MPNVQFRFPCIPYGIRQWAVNSLNASELQLADLILVRGNQWVDLPVKLVTKSQYTHVAGYVGANKLIEAQGLRKTGYQGLQTYYGACDIYRCPALNFSTSQQVILFSESKVGSHYDYPLLAWEFFRFTFGVMLPYVKNNRRICSTLWADAYKHAGVHLCPTQEYPTPSDLVKSPLLRKIGSL